MPLGFTPGPSPPGRERETTQAAGDAGAHPEKLESAVRKWVTYIALLIAAGLVIGDLIMFLSYFLRGELTPRFFWRVITVLAIAGGVFWYYLLSVQKPRSSQSG